jgi:DNA-binding Lrp family transcriptional regulator
MAPLRKNVAVVDEIDQALLDAVQENGSLSLSELGRRIGLTSAPTQRRLRALEQAGWIERYVALLSEDHLGLDLVVFIEVRLDRLSAARMERFEAAVEALENVLECHRITGDYHYMLKVIANSRRAFSSFYTDRLLSLAGVVGTRQTVSLQKVKSTTRLPLREAF